MISIKSEKENSFNIFLVDDHPFIMNAYIHMINSIETIGYKNQFIQSTNCEEAFDNLKTLKKENKKLDLAIIDIGLTPYKNLKSGSDIAIMVKDLFPNCKIMIITAFNEPIAIYNLLQKVTIETVVCKSDIDHIQFIDIYKKNLTNDYFMSPIIKNEMIIIAKRKFGFDRYDFEILQRISENVKTKDLPKYIPLSLSAIEKRKANIKSMFFKESNFKDFLIKITENVGLL